MPPLPLPETGSEPALTTSHGAQLPAQAAARGCCGHARLGAAVGAGRTASTAAAPCSPDCCSDRWCRSASEDRRRCSQAAGSVAALTAKHLGHQQHDQRHQNRRAGQTLFEATFHSCRISIAQARPAPDPPHGTSRTPPRDPLAAPARARARKPQPLVRSARSDRAAAADAPAVPRPTGRAARRRCRPATSDRCSHRVPCATAATSLSASMPSTAIGAARSGRTAQ